ncbi:MAG: hypothetical protein WCP56_03885, partial [Candidatus Saccharibacteria bacterium]
TTTTPPTQTKTPPTQTKTPPTPTKKNKKPKIKVKSKKVHDKKVQVAIQKAKFYPHNFGAFTRVIHTCCFEKNKVMNYDAWWTDSSKKELVVQMRVYIPANSQYIPSKFRSAVFDGNRRLAYFRISDGVPASWYASPNATSSQINNTKAPSGRYYGEAHIKASDIKGDLITFQTYYISNTKNEKGIDKGKWSKTVKINKNKLAIDNPKSKVRRTVLITPPASQNPILTYKVDKATMNFTGCVNKTNKNKLDLTMTANVPANFNYILSAYQANYTDGANKKIKVLGLSSNMLPEGAKASSLTAVNPPAGEYKGTTTIAKVPDLKLGLFYNTEDSNTAKGFLAGQTVLTNRFPVCQ